MTDGLLRVGIARSLPGFLARYPGVALDALLAEVGIDAVQLADPDALLSLRRCIALLEAATRATGDTTFGLSFAAQLPWQDLGVFGYVLLHSPTLGAALGNGARYFAVQQTAGRLTLEVEADVARLIHEPGAPSRGGLGQGPELTLALFTRLCREGTGCATWAPREVGFAHRQPRTTAAQERFFRAAVHYDRPANVLALDARDLRRAFRTADADLLPILLRHADDSLARMPAADDFHGEVRRLVMAGLGAGEVTVEHVAARLGMSPRSVQRRLQDHGQSFQAVVGEARLALSQRYLADASLSLTETAFLLGYSDLSAFSRAFRRWTGESALAFRRRATTAAAR